MELDALVVGAGFSGLYMLHKLRSQGLRVKAFESEPGVGGTWYKNRYPGARCDTESEFYCYSFSDEILEEWNWSEKFPAWDEILRYLNYVADKLELRDDIVLSTRIETARYDAATERWTLTTSNGQTVTTQHIVLAVGPLSAAPILPNIKGTDKFAGESHHTGAWPHEPVSYKGKRIGLIGTGSSGSQVLPVVAEDAEKVYVFQRTPPYVTPARNRPLDPEYIREVKANYRELWDKARNSTRGIPYNFDPRSAVKTPKEDREELFESLWQAGGNQFIRKSFHDIFLDQESNDILVDFVHRKIDELVDDPEVAEKLKGHDYPIGTKRPVTTDGYYESFNSDNVTLVDVRSDPIAEITEKGVKTGTAEYELDMLIYASGFDSSTGPFTRMDIHSKDGTPLKEVWKDGVRTYLGLMVPGFPNMYMICGPQSPAILSNAPPCLEQGVEWISDCIEYMKKNDIAALEADPEKALEWGRLCNELVEKTLIPKAKTSWFMGHNVPGKPKEILGYIGGLNKFGELCNGIASSGYQDFELRRRSGS